MAFIDVRFFLILFRFFALVPIINGSNIKSNLLLMHSLLAIFSSTFVIFYLSFVKKMFDSNTLFYFVLGLLICSFIITHVCCVFLAMLKRRDQMNIFEIIRNVDEMLIRNFNYGTVDEHWNAFGFKASGVIGTIAISYTYIMVMEKTGFIFFYIYALFAIRISCIQLMFYVDMVAARLKQINHELNEIIEIVNHYSFSETFKGDVENYCYERILMLKNIYGKLWDTKNLINNCFGLSFLIHFVDHFVELVIYGYLIYMVIFLDKIPQYVVASAVVACMVTIVPFAVVCFSCDNCTDEVNSYNFSLVYIFN